MTGRREDVGARWHSLGASLARWRKASPLTQSDLGRLTHYSRTSISHIEAGRQSAPRSFWEAADQAYEAGGALLTEYDRAYTYQERARIIELEQAQEDRKAQIANGSPFGGAPALLHPNITALPHPLSTKVRVDSDYIERLHGEIKGFVRLDQQYGGAVTSPLIVQAFKQARHRVKTSEIQKGLARDADAATAELAEVAGWSLYDAERHQQAHEMNVEALKLARRAGDRSMELFIMQNMSMHASHLGHAQEALDIARSALDAKLTPRLQSLFRLREARALAELGADGDSRKTFRLARDLHADGVSDRDPHWAWWVDDAEFAWHEGKIQLDLGERGRALDFFDLAANGISEHRVRTFYSYRASAFVAHVINKSWPDAERSMKVLLGHIGLVGSRRGDRTVEHGLDLLDRTAAPGTITDLARALRKALALTI
ncbi:helix-turn-helix domain-containing protein [Actinokineospora cianjurensis]|uniref:Helix-turn-helix protein n=1 Tax=Actinokineospora cianjurensis TaxID=585224 RepID=A0A421BC05_9PSEU|nr:helix-turn-helix transcriptional regulator [Actinokineospora cianjurensis]RLK61904.1 helix-turn-helix protein [Actinokineospora cianjurensis]